MTTFVKFQEECDHEGETWVFWLQVDGNAQQLDRLSECIRQYEEAQGSDSEYQLWGSVLLSEHDVNVLVEHGGRGYMNNHHKVLGVLTVPDDLVQDSGYGASLESLYKAGITKLFKES